MSNLPRDTGPAKLPGLPAVNQANLLQVVQALVERAEVREGARGNPYERAVTVRELVAGGFTGLAGFPNSNRGAVGNVLTVNSDGTYSSITPDAFAESIRKSKLYADLMKRLDDATRFDGLPEQVKAVLLADLAAEAAKRGAEIQRLEYKLQTATDSLAYTVQEVTAAVDGSMSGVRQTVFASATESRATAGTVTQLVANLDGTGSATIEDSLVVIADRTDGLRAQKMLKLSAGNAVAGYGLMASEDPGGTTASAFIVQADQFSLTSGYNFSQGTTPSAASAGQTWYNTTTKLSYRSTASGTGSWTLYTPVIPFGVDTATGTVYINGNVRINSGGTPLNSVGTVTNSVVVFAYQRSVSAPSGGPLGGVTYTFSTKTLGGSFLNGWQATIPAGTNPLYVVTAVAAGTTNVVTIGSSDWSSSQVLAQDGTAGLNVAVAELFQRTVTNVAPTAQANTVTFTFATGGMTGMSSGWTAAVPSSGGGYLWVTRASASSTTATDTIPNSEWSSPVLMAQDGATGGTGSTGATGTRGTRQLYDTSGSYTASYNNGAGAGAPSYNAQATTLIAAATAGSSPTTPIKGDTVTFTNGTSYTYTVTYSGSAWAPPGVIIDGSLLVTGSVTATQLAATAIDGKVITGSTLKTGSSGARVEIFNGNQNIVGIDSGGISRVILNANAGRIYLISDTTYAVQAELSTGANTGAKAVWGSLPNTVTNAFAVYGDVSYSLTNTMAAGGFSHTFSGNSVVLANKDYAINAVGPVRFGTHTGSGDVACNGYITITDSAGTTRKLMTTA